MVGTATCMAGSGPIADLPSRKCVHTGPKTGQVSTRDVPSGADGCRYKSLYYNTLHLVCKFGPRYASYGGRTRAVETGMAFDLEGLYRSSYDAVVRFLYRKVWDADRAEDLAQEVFMRAMRHQPEKPRSWVFAVAANIARDEARSAIRRRKHLTLLTHEPIASP
ncbi:MAG: hypothetical protein CVV20_04505, partial [Gemmatimonadetes bacterium HGW-Gemmatimonadetes-1]